MATFEFSIRYQTRNVVIIGTATVVGECDGPSKPKEMVRSALGAQKYGDRPSVDLTWINEPVEDSTETCKHGTLKNYTCVLCETPVPGPPNPPKGEHPREFG